MALKDLIQTTEKIEDTLEAILKGRTNLVIVSGKKTVKIRKELMKSLDNSTKILLYLAGKLAWLLIDKSEYWVKPGEIEKELFIPGGSIRPVLMNFKNDRLIEFNKKERGYRITPLGVLELENLLQKYEKKQKK